MKLIRFSQIIGVIAIFLSFISAILYFQRCDIAGAVGVVSTIISALLGVISIIYTYISGNKTEKLLDEISKQNRILTDKIHMDLVLANFDDENIHNLENECF